MDSKKCFIEFLKENKVLSKFIKNFKKQKNWRIIEDRPISSVDYFKTMYEDNFIIHAFLWRNTMEGHSFWSDLSEAWLAKLCALKYNENYYDF